MVEVSTGGMVALTLYLGGNPASEEVIVISPFAGGFLIVVLLQGWLQRSRLFLLTSPGMGPFSSYPFANLWTVKERGPISE